MSLKNDTQAIAYEIAHIVGPMRWLTITTDIGESICHPEYDWNKMQDLNADSTLVMVATHIARQTYLD